MVKPDKFVMDVLAKFADGALFPVVLDAVLEGEIDIKQKFLDTFLVLVILELVINCSEVHRVRNYLIVIGDVHPLRVDGLAEDPGVVQFAELRHQSLRGEVPCLENRSICFDSSRLL